MLVPSFLLSCSGYDREQFRLQQGKRYVLKQMPDSAFVAHLDSLFRNEPLKQPESEEKPEIAIGQGSWQGPALKNSKPSPAPEKPEAVQPSPAPSNGEMFAERFMDALALLQADPNNARLGQRVTAKSGESLMDLMVRVYGSRARQMPSLMVQSQLRGINPGLDLSSLHEGDALLLPRP